MEKRTYLEDIISLALLYRKKYIGTEMISYESILKYNKVIEDNLISMNSQCFDYTKSSDYVSVYRLVTDENFKKHAIILSSINLNYAWSIYSGCLPKDVWVASQMDNALEVIGLKKDMIKDELPVMDDLNKISKNKDEFRKKCKILKFVK